jgi:hypothetical protein
MSTAKYIFYSSQTLLEADAGRSVCCCVLDERPTVYACLGIEQFNKLGGFMVNPKAEGTNAGIPNTDAKDSIPRPAIGPFALDRLGQESSARS